MSVKKRTMHDHFMAKDRARARQQITKRNEVIHAVRERQKAQQLLDQANAKLFEADRVFEDARLTREGWRMDDLPVWDFDRYYARWRHSTFELVRTINDRAVQWVCIDHPNDIFVHRPTLDEALEWWLLASTDMGRCPEPPPKDLFTRLRETV